MGEVGYALMQPDATPLEAGVVEEAFAEVDGLVAADGASHARRSRGVLVSGLRKEAAKALQSALLERGVVVERAEDRWLTVPPITRCRKAAVEAEGLVVQDMYGRPTTVPFERILAVAGGMVTEGEIERTKDARVVRRGRYGVEVEDAEHGYAERDNLVLDIVSDEPVRRYRIEADRFDYGYLGERKRGSSLQNMALVVGDLLGARPAIPTGRGVERLLAGGRKQERYRHPRDLDREIAWLLWRRHGPGAALDGVIDHRTEPLGDQPPTAAERFEDNVKAATVERIRQDLSMDRERYLARTKTLDMALGGVAGALAVAYVTFDMGLSLAEDGVGFLFIAVITFATVGAVAFFGIRQWRAQSFWTDGPR